MEKDRRLYILFVIFRRVCLGTSYLIMHVKKGSYLNVERENRKYPNYGKEIKESKKRNI